MAWNVYTVSTKTWADRVKVDASSCSWGRAKNHGESGSASFQLGDPDVAETAGLYDLYPGQRAVVADWDGVVVYAGIIWDAEYQRDSMSLNVSHSDLWSLWDRRLVVNDRGENVAKSELTYSGWALRTLGKRVVQAGTTGTGYGIPLVFDADSTGGNNSRTYYGYDMLTVTEALNELMEQENGPDIDFRPRWASDGSLEWVMRAGDLTANTVEYDFTAENSGARGLWIKTSATDLVTRVYGVGEGSEVDMLVRVSTSSNIDTYPAMEAVESFKDVKSSSQLHGLAQEALRANNGATRQAGFQVLVDGADYKVSALQPGTQVRWNIRNDPYFTDGYRTWEVVKYSGGLGDWVTLEFQEKGG